MMEYRIRYATSSDGTRIAFRVIGSGYPIVQLPFPFASYLENEWGSPEYRAWFEGLSANFTIVRYDGRGLGLSDRNPSDLSMEAALSDLDSVVSALGVQSFAIFAVAASGPVAIEYAARNSSVSHLILWHAVARASEFFENPERRALKTLAMENWDFYALASASAYRGWALPESAKAEASIFKAVDQKYFFEMLEAQKAYDATNSLMSVRAKTLVMHRRDYKGIDISNSKFIASNIVQARLEILDGSSGLYVGDETVLSAIRSFIRQDEMGKPPHTELGVLERGAIVGLTVREAEVLRLVATGLGNWHIAQQMGISVHTVERHLANIYEKWGIHSRVELILRLLNRRGWESGDGLSPSPAFSVFPLPFG